MPSGVINATQLPPISEQVPAEVEEEMEAMGDYGVRTAVIYILNRKKSRRRSLLKLMRSSILQSTLRSSDRSLRTMRTKARTRLHRRAKLTSFARVRPSLKCS
jgi:hypothetical protein